MLKKTFTAESQRVAPRNAEKIFAILCAALCVLAVKALLSVHYLPFIQSLFALGVSSMTNALFYRWKISPENYSNSRLSS
jgi:hypothetical protein